MAEAHPQHLGLARRQRVEDVLADVAQAGVDRGVGRGDRRQVLDEVAEVRVVVVADRRLHRDRLLGDLEDLADLLLGISIFSASSAGSGSCPVSCRICREIRFIC